MPSRSGINSLVPFLASLWIIWAFGLHTLGARLWTQLDGVVIGSRDVPPTRGPRYVTEYTVREHAGREVFYTAGPTDASLSRSMPIGTRVTKQRWHVDWERDGRRVNDFSLSFYLLMSAIGWGLLVWSALLWHDQKRQ
jgi:hypothetical protein